MVHPRARILVVDDDLQSREGLQALLESWGYAVITSADGESALQTCRQALPDAIVTDLMMPGLSGLELVDALGDKIEQVAVVLVTGHATIESAVQAIKLGAYDYLTKPVDVARLREIIEKGLRHALLVRETKALRGGLESPLGSYADLVGKSPPMRELYQKLNQVAGTDASVLVHGESGTGKELVAQTLHRLSARREGPFLAVNCAAMPPSLMESEILGHEKGAFTGAATRYAGCFEQADGGTLFLDEITEMASEVQAKFLRALEEGKVRRIGGNAAVSVSVRVVAATNRQPSAAIQGGKLREDLFYRLGVFQIELPPLRERGADVILLARYFLESAADKYQRAVPPWDSDFEDALRAYRWPGNVRELKNSMERLAVLFSGPKLTAADFDRVCLEGSQESREAAAPVSLVEAEREAIKRALSSTGGNKTQAARLLGISPKTLHAKLALYRLNREE